MKKNLIVLFLLLLIIVVALHIPTSAARATTNLTVTTLVLKANLAVEEAYSAGQTWVRAEGWFPKECGSPSSKMSHTVTDISTYEHKVDLVAIFSGDHTLDFCQVYVGFAYYKSLGNYPAGRHLFWINQRSAYITLRENQ